MAANRCRGEAFYWTVLLVLVISMSNKCQACETTEMCSAGKVKPWRGSIDTHESLLSALEARSFNKEIVITVVLDNWIEMLAQQWMSMQRLGMGHLLALASPDAKVCDLLLTAVPELGCAWSDALKNYWFEVPLYQMHAFRHMVAARIARAGWNVLVIDGDVFWVGDPYRYLKSPPMKEYQLIVHQEGGWALNCGSYYVQNSEPSGPAVYFLSEVVDRALRHNDDKFKWLDQRGYNWLCVSWEQEAFSDVWFAMLTGSPVLGWNAVRNCRAANASEIGKVEGDIVDAELRRVLNETGSGDHHFDMSQYEWWSGLHRTPGFKTKTTPIRIPRYDLRKPSTFPGYEVGPARGDWASSWMKQLQEANLEAPLWPDPEDPTALSTSSEESKATLEVTHYMMQAPNFLFSTWFKGGHRGLWSNHSVPGHVRPRRKDPLSIARQLQTGAGVGSEGVSSMARMHAPSGTPMFHSIGSHKGLNLAALEDMYMSRHLVVPSELLVQLADEDDNDSESDVEEHEEAGQQQGATEGVQGFTGEDGAHQHQHQRSQHASRRNLFTTGTALAHYTAMPFTPAITKLMAPRYLDMFDWDLHEAVKGRLGLSEAPYYASLPGRSVPKLLAYHPSLPLHLAHNVTSFQIILRGLAQVAVVLNRTVLWPDIPCSAAWISPQGPRHLLRPPYFASLDPHAQPYGRLGVQRCWNQRYTQDSCLIPGRGMTEAEFSRVLNKTSTPDAYKPSHDNTVLRLSLLQQPRKALRHLSTPDSVASSSVGGGHSQQQQQQQPFPEHPGTATPDLVLSMFRVRQTDVAALQASHGDAPILYLAQPLEVDWTPRDPLRQEYDNFQMSCAALGSSWLENFKGPHTYNFPLASVAT